MKPFSRSIFALGLGIALVAAAPRAVDAAALRAGLGGPRGYGVDSLPPGDDAVSASIPLTAAFPLGLRFAGMTYAALFVNNNGNVSFGASVVLHNPLGFPSASQRMIAPWFGDVDTRGQSVPAAAGVFWDVRAGQVTVTWSNVGYFAAHSDLRNDFQLILRSFPGCGVGAFDVEFRYNQCQWVTGDATGGVGGHGGTPAQAGFDASDRIHFFSLPGSLTETVANLCTTSNVGEPGVWRFRIRDGELPCTGQGAACTTAMPGTCAQGANACRSGTAVCTADALASTERCDGVDNDCNGMTDEGAALCPAAQLCDRGACVQRCVAGGCGAGQTCTARGDCVDDACVAVSCSAGQRCELGSCVDVCAGIRCPSPSVCRLGRCVVPCDGATCDPGLVCENGRCMPNCNCRPCATNYACEVARGVCIPADCIGMSCASPQYCRSALIEEPGSTARCQDACTNAACPRGQMCTNGACVVAVPDAGTPDSGEATDTGTLDTGGLDVNNDGGLGADGGPRADGPGDTGSEPVTRTGCACRTAGTSRFPSTWGFPSLVAGVAALVTGRRRRATLG